MTRPPHSAEQAIRQAARSEKPRVSVRADDLRDLLLSHDDAIVRLRLSEQRLGDLVRDRVRAEPPKPPAATYAHDGGASEPWPQLNALDLSLLAVTHAFACWAGWWFR